MKPAFHSINKFPLPLTIFFLIAIPLFFFSQRSMPMPQPIPLVSPPTVQPTQAAVIDYKKLGKLLEADVRDHDPKYALSHLAREIEGNNELSNHCHALTHIIGRTAFTKYKVIDSALVFESNLCGSGYLHGVIEERLAQSSNIFADLQSMCKPDDGNCNHGMGHGLMYYTGNDIPKSLLFCDQITDNRGKLFCSEGVFMENFNTDQQLHPSIYLRADDPSYPCAEQSQFYKGTCYFYAPDYYLNLHEGGYREALQWCHSIEKDFRIICITGAGSRTMKRNITNPAFVEHTCMELPAEERRFCIEGMTSYYIVHYYSLSKAKSMCATLLEENRPICEHATVSRKDMFPD